MIGCRIQSLNLNEKGKAQSAAPYDNTGNLITGFNDYVDNIDRDSIYDKLICIAADSMEGRAAGTRGYNRAADWLAREFHRLGLKMARGSYYQRFIFLKSAVAAQINLPDSLADTLITANVIGVLPGSDSILKNDYVVITAHLDHIGRRGDTIYGGANDNASGVAVMLETARVFSNLRTHPRRTLVFIAFSGEEAGLLGSRYFVEHPLIPLEKIRLLINLDLVGSGTDGIMLQGGDRYPAEEKIILSLNKACFNFTMSTRPNSANSDHYFFNMAGVPSFFIYTYNGTCAYHSPLDTPACIDRHVLEKVATLVAAIAAHFAER